MCQCLNFPRGAKEFSFNTINYSNALTGLLYTAEQMFQPHFFAFTVHPRELCTAARGKVSFPLIIYELFACRSFQTAARRTSTSVVHTNVILHRKYHPRGAGPSFEEHDVIIIHIDHI